MTKVIKKLVIFCIFMVLVFLHSFGDSEDLSERHEKGIYILINGGCGFFNGGDFNKLIDNNILYAGIQNQETVHDPFFWNFGLEIGKCFGNLSVGIEAGYFTRTFKMGGRTFYPDAFHNWHFSSVPVLINVQYQVLKNSVFSLYIKGGGGFYFGSLREEVLLNGDYSCEETSTDISPGIHAGILIDLKLSNSISVFVESRFRMVNFKELDGHGTRNGDTDYSGELYYKGQWSPQYCDYFSVGESPGCRSAEINLNGITTNIGLKINL